MRIRSTLLLLAVAMIPVVAAFAARPRVVPPPAPRSPVRWTVTPYRAPAPKVRSVVVQRGADRLGISSAHHVVRSTDGGKSWTDVRMPARFLAADLAFASVNNGYVIGGIGQLLRTRDGGRSWTYEMLPTRSLLNAIAAPDAATLVVVGSDGVILRSADGGAEWQSIAAGTDVHLRDVAFADATRGIAVGMWGTVLLTEDGGRSWTQENAGTRTHLTRVEWDAAGNVSIANDDTAIAFRRTSNAN